MLLAVDTSTAQVGLALCDGNRLGAELVWISKRHHTVEVAPALADLLNKAEITIHDIEALGVAIGPGSFTALRVGLALVKGMAVARKLPVIGIPSLDILAAGQPASRLPLAAVLQAGRGRIVLGWYKVMKPKSGPTSSGTGKTQGGWRSQGAAQITTVESLADSIEAPTMVAGELTSEERQRLARKKVNVVLASPSLCVRRPSVLAELAWARWRNGQVDDPRALAPIYLQLN